MESSALPQESNGTGRAPDNMNSPAALRVPNDMNPQTVRPAPMTEVEASSLAPRLDLSTAPLSITEAVQAVMANAAPPTQSSAPNHPPYAEMITSAIRALNERKGSSKTAIKKYIDSTYANLPSAHASLLSTHLKRLKNTGAVVMVKHSYKLPKPKKITAPGVSSSSAAAAVAAAPGVASLSVPEKRGRGRPPKSNPVGTELALPKRRPGRPIKNRPLVVGSEGKRGRGRPPKSKPILVLGSNGFVTQPKPKRQQKRTRPIIDVTPSYGIFPPKQPRKSPAVRIFVSADGVGKGSVITGIPRSRGRPRKNTVPASGDVGASPSVRVVSKGSGRPRGRPKKVIGGAAEAVAVAPLAPAPSTAPVGEPFANAVASSGVQNNTVLSPEKRGRGRPRKVDGVGIRARPVGQPKKIKRISPVKADGTPRRPVGRPKKIKLIPTGWEEADVIPKRPVGRPKDGTPRRPVGRPKKIKLIPTGWEEADVIPKRPVGRPKKVDTPSMPDTTATPSMPDTTATPAVPETTAATPMLE